MIANPIWLELEVTKALDPNTPLINQFTGSTPVLPRARAWRFHFVLLYNDALDSLVSNISSVTLEVKTKDTPSSAPLISVSITGAAVNAALTDAQRQSKTDQHFIIDVPAGSTGLNMGGANVLELEHDLIVTATRNGNLVTLCQATFAVRNDGGQYSGNTPTAGDPTYYTKAQIDGILGSFVKLLNEPGVMIVFQSQNGTYKRLLGVDNDGNRIDDVQ